jgi:hypothetical protein
MEFLPFLSFCAGSAGFGFAVWTYLASRKIADIRYEVSQFADYRMPSEFLKEVSKAPVKIRAISAGNKAAQNVALKIKTRFPIVACEPDPPELRVKISNNEIRVEIDKLNPHQEPSLFVTCNGDPSVDQLEAIQITHDEGVAQSMTPNKYLT